jgi:hypothetical protein
MARTSATPKPIVTKTVCSLCGLDWEKHPENASAVDCIDLLKAEAAKPRPVVIPISQEQVVPWQLPKPQWEAPRWTQPGNILPAPRLTGMMGGRIEGGSGTAARY